MIQTSAASSLVRQHDIIFLLDGAPTESSVCLKYLEDRGVVANLLQGELVISL